ncbi:MAG: hypothetical protein ACTHXV_09325 [Canibacter sp.]
MPAALTPRLSILLPGFLVLLIVLTESYGISQEFGWPLHLSGQIEPLVPRLASLIWEMTYIYWVLARVSSLVGEWGSVAFYRHGSLTRWLLHTWASELLRILAIVMGSLVVGVATRMLLTSPQEMLGRHDYWLSGLNGSFLAILQFQFDFIWCAIVIICARSTYTTFVVLTLAVAMGALRNVVLTPMQNFGVLQSEPVFVSACILTGLSATAMLGLRLVEGRITHEKSSNRR